MKKYFLHDGSQQTGPFDFEELKLKDLKMDTAIWFEGLEEWTIVGKVDELKELITIAPPLFLPKTPSKIEENIHSTKPVVKVSPLKNTKIKQFIMLGAFFVIALTGFYIYNLIQLQNTENERQAMENAKAEAIAIEEEEKALIRNSINTYVTAERNSYKYSELGGIYGLKISVTNSTNYLIDNVVVKVNYIKANGDIWDSQTLDFNYIDPQTKTTIEAPDSERGTSVEYEIVSIKSAALGLN